MPIENYNAAQLRKHVSFDCANCGFYGPAFERRVVGSILTSPAYIPAHITKKQNTVELDFNAPQDRETLRQFEAIAAQSDTTLAELMLAALFTFRKDV